MGDVGNGAVVNGVGGTGGGGRVGCAVGYEEKWKLKNGS